MTKEYKLHYWTMRDSDIFILRTPNHKSNIPVTLNFSKDLVFEVHLATGHKRFLDMIGPLNNN